MLENCLPPFAAHAIKEVNQHRPGTLIQISQDGLKTAIEIVKEWNLAAFLQDHCLAENYYDHVEGNDAALIDLSPLD